MPKNESTITVPNIFRQLLVFLCVGFSSLSAQQPEPGISINILDSSGTAQSKELYLNGYRKTVAGQTLDYHSSHPDAGSALLVRAQKETHSISWQTDTLASPPSGDFHKFVWLAGVERSGWGESNPAHAFDLSVNGEHWFTFKNYKDSTAPHWTLRGRDGAELSFQSTMADRFGDLFGYMYLNLPVKDFKAGSPLTLRVDGEDAGSMDWFMVFQYRFNFHPNVRMEPVLLKGPSGESQMLRLSLDNLQSGRSIAMKTPSGSVINKPLDIGANIFMLPIPAVTATQTMPLDFFLNNTPASRVTVTVEPVKKRDIYLLCYSHNDIGYTDLQPAIKQRQWDNLEKSLALIDKTRDYPTEARYKWNVEILWPLKSYMEEQPEQKRLAVLDAIKSGGIGLNALYVNPLTGLANTIEMSHYLDYARAFSAQYSIPISTALVSDIPGFTWGIVPALAQSDVKYFSSSPNNGDRVGFVYDWGDKPFYWTSQSGKEKVLFWMAGMGYSTFHEGQLSLLGDEKILKLVRKLDETNYPYDIYQLPYTTGDNGAPDSTLSDYVKSWNERYSTPRLIIATHRQMFTEFEKRHGASLPSFKGDFTPYWEDGAMSTTFETIENRHSVGRLIQGEALWSMLAPEKFPDSAYSIAWQNVSLWDEHTWGAANSITEPDSPGVIGQWKIKKQYATDADSLSRELLSRAFPSPAPDEHSKNSIDIYNTNSWNRTDIVSLSPEQSNAGDLVLDEKGMKIPSQRLTTGEMAVLVRNIPPMSAIRLFIKKGGAFSRGQINMTGNSMETDRCFISVNPRTGAIASVRMKSDGVQLIDTTTPLGANRYIYVPGVNPDSALFLKNVKIRIKEKGNLFASLIIEGEAPGCKSYRSEVRVFNGIDRIDITNEMDKIAVRDKEGVHVAFPFNVPGGEIRYDVAGGIVSPEKDQLSGACKNFFSLQSWVDISNKNYGVTLASPDIPLIEIGSITAEQPWMRTIAPSSRIYSYVMNNYWHTNYKADQEGLVTIRYSIMPHDKYDPLRASRFGMELRQRLIAVSANSANAPKSLFTIAPQIIEASMKPLEGGTSWLLYLYNPIGKDQHFTIKGNNDVRVACFESDPSGKRGMELPDNAYVAGMGSLYVRVEKM